MKVRPSITPCAGSSSTKMPFELRQELVAVAHARAEPAGLPRLGQRALDAVLAQAGECWPIPASGGCRGPARAPRERSRASIACKDAGAAGGIVAGADRGSAGQACPPDIPARARSSASRAARASAPSARPHCRSPPPTTLPRIAPSTPRTELRLRIGLARLRVVGGDVADLMAEREGKLGLIVHQRHELARDVDVAARRREGVLDRRIEDREAIVRCGATPE